MAPVSVDPDRLLHSPWTAGVVGSLVALRFVPGLTWFGRACNVAGGTACAGWLSPPLAEWLQSSASHSLQGGVAFLAGLFGLSVVAAVQEAIRTMALGDVIRGWISRR